MAVVVKNLWVQQDFISISGKQIPFWGFASSRGGPPLLPGPVIEAEMRDRVIIHLRNPLFPRPVSIIFPGQEIVWVRKPNEDWKFVSPQYINDKMVSLTDYLESAARSSISYQIAARRPGVFLYESGTNPEEEVQMGLYGTLVIRPIGYNTPSHPNYKTAYGAGTGSKFDVEKILVLGELDGKMHNLLSQGEMYSILNYNPDHWIINGRTYPDTIRDNHDPALPSQPLSSSIKAQVGQKVLIRVINAGFHPHTLQLGGLVGHVVAGDGYPLITPSIDLSYNKTSVTLGSGQSYDILLTMETKSEYYLCAREYNHLVNGTEYPGGMMTKITVN